MSRLIKKIAREELGLGEIVNGFDQSIKNVMINDVIRKAKVWLDSEIEDKDVDSLDSFDLIGDFGEEMLNDPDEILEAVIDAFPENMSDNDIYGASHEEKVRAVETILDFSDDALGKLFNDGIDETINNHEDQDSNENNYPYGPGMSQRDFL